MAKASKKPVGERAKLGLKSLRNPLFRGEPGSGKGTPLSIRMSSRMVLKKRMDSKNFEKLMRLRNPALNRMVARYALICDPKRIFVNEGTEEDHAEIRRHALEGDEEISLAGASKTIHFDGPKDPARAVEQTSIIVPKGMELEREFIRTREEADALDEAHRRLKGSMKGKTMYVQLHMLGPIGSPHSRAAVQITDSAYVAHNENLLYRQAYGHFAENKPNEFMKFVHSAGELEHKEDMISKNLGQRGVYLDPARQTAISVNTQYGGNSIGLKKLAMRLMIHKANIEGGSLLEHMFVIGLENKKKGRITNFAGAFPSACGKTSTAMVPNSKVVGDDIAILWRDKEGRVRAANTEKGMFGIVEDINERDDPITWHMLNTSDAEVIFSNVLMDEKGNPYWVGSGKPKPKKGRSLWGKWFEGAKDEEGKELPPSHKNARFTAGLESLPNVHKEALHDPEGVPLDGIIYGGRDYDTSVPVQESFSWEHGMVAYAASLESAPTQAVLTKSAGLRFDPMSNLDFLSIPLSKYIENNIQFGKEAKNAPKIFSVNYFLKKEFEMPGGLKKEKFLNDKVDKVVWLRWMEGRVHGEFGTIKAPTGKIPKYDDLKALFHEELGKNYSMEDYVSQFTIRIPENLRKIARIREIYTNRVKNTPKIVFKVLDAQETRLREARERYGTDYITPEMLEKNPL